MLLFGPCIKAAPNLGSIPGALAVGTVTNIRYVLTRTRRALKRSFRFQFAVETLSPAGLNSACSMSVQRPLTSSLYASCYPLRRRLVANVRG